MSPNPTSPSLHGVIASLLWLSAHPDRRLCLHHEIMMQQQMHYLAQYDGEIEPLLRTVAQQLAEELDVHIREQLAVIEEDSSPGKANGTWVN